MTLYRLNDIEQLSCGLAELRLEYSRTGATLWELSRTCHCFFFVFFFQAEDGIRDLIVTGVQTCALPICVDAPRRGRLLPVGEACLRALLGILERLALLGLLADRHGDLPGAVPPVLAVLPPGARALRGVGRSARGNLGSHVAQPARHPRGGDRIRVVRSEC